MNRRRAWRRILIALVLVPLLAAGGVFADWWSTIPESARAHYVGGTRCIDCHAAEYHKWQNSHHDLAMQVADEATVLGDFNNANIEHHGIRSRMYRRAEKFYVETEGPDGNIQEFEIKYCFGVEPLQQYMVEFDRDAETPANALGRLQVLRISWDTKKKQWFYLPPPDVPGKIDPRDDLHWTGIAQRWNTMCAECHSTNLKKNYDESQRQYATTFADIDVNCEACHGPGSIHVQLASAHSLFWDRKRGYGLPDLKAETSDLPEVETCAPCHSRRRVLKEGFPGGAHFADYFELELPGPLTYFADGQILDEVYEYGSFLQSRMYHQSVRCSDCHDPHSVQLKHSGNQVCTSCHQHPAGRYDTPSHHHHLPGSTGASCVECHMPATTYMEVDSRRDHSFRVPRPDLSLKHGFPNACTACHLDRAKVSEQKRSGFQQYRDWVLAARTDPEVADALRRVNQWASDHAMQWFPFSRYRTLYVHPGELLASAWNDESVVTPVWQLIRRRDYAGVLRAAAIQQMRHAPEALNTARDCLHDPDPLVRAAAAKVLEQIIPSAEELQQLPPNQQVQIARQLRTEIAPLFKLLNDPLRVVRLSATAVLVRIPRDLLPSLSTGPQRELLAARTNELLESWQLLNDRAAGHNAMALIYEDQGHIREAIAAYRKAILVEPGDVGARSNLALLLEQSAQEQSDSAPLLAEAQRLRKEELELFARDVQLAPEMAEVHYRYGMALYLDGQKGEALQALSRAYELRPREVQYVLALATLHHELGHAAEAVKFAEELVQLAPDNESFQLLLRDVKQSAAPEASE